jgi:hypothetical protein
MKKMAGSGPLHACVNLRRTHLEFAGQLGIRGPLRASGHNFEHDEDVLRLQNHNAIRYSRFANSEWRVVNEARFRHVTVVTCSRNGYYSSI